MIALAIIFNSYMNKSRFCGSERIVKNGFMEGKQRCKSRDCGRNLVLTNKNI
jgi:transposase-like protein